MNRDRREGLLFTVVPFILLAEQVQEVCICRCRKVYARLRYLRRPDTPAQETHDQRMNLKGGVKILGCPSDGTWGAR